MYHTDNPAGVLEIETYEESHFNIQALKKNLMEDQIANLAREVIRRVASRDFALNVAAPEPIEAELEAFCVALISDDNSAAATIISEIRAEGASAEYIYLKHLSAAARMLGTWWTEDRIDFNQVTIGSSRMFAIMRGMRHLFQPVTQLQGKYAIFSSVPGEDHTMGVRMAADLFRKEGWDIALKLGSTHDELVADVERTPDGIVGLSISGRHSIDPLSRLVIALKICCPHTPILVSGQDVEDVVPLLNLMGVDRIATDIEDAKEQMSALWDLRAIT